MAKWTNPILKLAKYFFKTFHFNWECIWNPHLHTFEPHSRRLQWVVIATEHQILFLVNKSPSARSVNTQQC